MEADKFLGNGGEQAEEQDIFELVPDGPAKFEGKLLLLRRRFKKIHTLDRAYLLRLRFNHLFLCQDRHRTHL